MGLCRGAWGMDRAHLAWPRPRRSFRLIAAHARAIVLQPCGLVWQRDMFGLIFNVSFGQTDSSSGREPQSCESATGATLRVGAIPGFLFRRAHLLFTSLLQLHCQWLALSC